MLTWSRFGSDEQYFGGSWSKFWTFTKRNTFDDAMAAFLECLSEMCKYSTLISPSQTFPFE